MNVTLEVWVFFMSCCISSAVCCVLFTSSMSGVALGYNYSLAEYIDLKETNVSVYLKRGVFDDEVVDDFEWRRSGHQPIAGHIRDDNLKTGAPEDDEGTAIRSGRRLDDSIFESDNNNKFEGSLMKLTAKAPHPSTNTQEVTGDMEMDEIASKYPRGSIDQLKAIQSLINMRKMEGARGSTSKGKQKSTYGYDERYLQHFPDYMDPSRRRMPLDGPDMNIPSNSARLAVPGSLINEPAKWMFPKYPDMVKAKLPETVDNGDRLTYPPPVTLRLSPVRPTRIKTIKPMYTAQTKPVTLQKIESRPQQPVDRNLDAFKEKLMLDKYDAPGIKSDEFLRKHKGGSYKTETEDYEDEIKGIPVRKKRDIDESHKFSKVKNPIPILLSVILPQNFKTLTVTDLITLKFEQGNENPNEIKNYRQSSSPTFVSKPQVSSKDNQITNYDISLSNEKVTGDTDTKSFRDFHISINDDKPLKLPLSTGEFIRKLICISSVEKYIL